MAFRRSTTQKNCEQKRKGNEIQFDTFLVAIGHCHLFDFGKSVHSDCVEPLSLHRFSFVSSSRVDQVINVARFNAENIFSLDFRYQSNDKRLIL